MRTCKKGQAMHLAEGGEMSEFDVGLKCLKLEQEGPLLWCTIDRPHARNAFTPAMYFGIKRAVRMVNDPRSEEHTSELQSLMRISYAVFCLKKKTKNTNITKHNANTTQN